MISIGSTSRRREGTKLPRRASPRPSRLGRAAMHLSPMPCPPSFGFLPSSPWMSVFLPPHSRPVSTTGRNVPRRVLLSASLVSCKAHIRLPNASSRPVSPSTHSRATVVSVRRSGTVLLVVCGRDGGGAVAPPAFPDDERKDWA